MKEKITFPNGGYYEGDFFRNWLSHGKKGVNLPCVCLQKNKIRAIPLSGGVPA